MISYQNLKDTVKAKHSYLCVGLDTDINLIPPYLLKYPDPVFEFNKQIIDATSRYCIAYKINSAFYESGGADGYLSLKKTVEYIPNDIFKIADAKRCDISNTARHYAKAFLEDLPFDAITLSPYMGFDSIKPFLDIKNKWVILLALTSNEGSRDFQQLTSENEYLFEKVIKISQLWAGKERMMYVAGATNETMIKRIRELIPEHFLLIPGVGTQGGDLNFISENCLSSSGGILVNMSRSILYKSFGEDFAIQAEAEAKTIREKMDFYLKKVKLKKTIIKN